MKSSFAALVLSTLPTCSLLAQDGVTPFAAAQLIGGSYDRFDLTVDLDLDGDPDYVGGYDDEIRWHRNRGDGLVDQTVTLLSQTGGTFSSVTRMDVDLDGHDDAVCFAADDGLVILARPGGPVTQHTALPSQPSILALADFQGDGRPEIVANAFNEVLVYSVHPQTYAIQQVHSAYSAVNQAFAIDFDGDGRDELCSYNASWIWVESLDPSWQPTTLTTFANPVTTELLPVRGDIDGDGDEDLVLFDHASWIQDRYIVFRRDAGGQLQQEAAVLGGPATHFGDVDGDGDLDGLCCGGGSGGANFNDVTSEYMISFNDGTGTFAPGVPILGIGARQLAGCVDVDGDGDRDLVGGRTVIFNPGDIQDVLAVPTSTRQRYEPLHDVNGDHDGDLVLYADLNQAGWFDARRDGTFVRQTSVLPQHVTGLRGTGLHADFDGDGAPDVLMQFSSGATAQLRLYHNFGGTFGVPTDAGPLGLEARQTTTSSGGNGVSWANHWRFCADWDADGDVDGVVVDESLGTTSLLQNDGTGWFTAGPNVPTGYVVLAVADVNGDGMPDLVAGLQGDLDFLYLLPGTGPGFGAPQLISNQVKRDERPGIVDIDDDGDLDILSSSQSGGVLLRNQGGGQFTAEPHAFASPRLAWWSFGDLDGNGTTDAIAYQAYFDARRTASILLQQPNGSFAPPVRLIAGVSAVHDIDLDGDLDLLGTATVFNRTATGSFGKLRQFGEGTPGTYNVRPHINDLGVAAPGNPMVLRVGGMRGGAAGLWVLGIGEGAVANTPLPGLTLYVDQISVVLPFVASGPQGAPGAGTWSVNWTMVGGLGGLQLTSQAFCADPLAPQGWTQTNGKRMTLPN